MGYGSTLVVDFPVQMNKKFCSISNAIKMNKMESVSYT